jgi:peptidoglycan/xylan/chitin deacetylase (PgdA/CDA1 family)
MRRFKIKSIVLFNLIDLRETAMHRSYVLITLLIALTTFVASNAEPHGVVLLYHHVATDTPPSTSISPENFRKHLEFLQDNKFNVISLAEMLNQLRAGEELTDKSIAITFDDGYSSIYETAFPMLQLFGFPFTLFLSTGPIDRQQANYISWEQIREMSDAGVQIANHMVEHPYMLDRRPQESQIDWLDRLEEELLIAEARIEEKTGQSHRYLAYPYGEFDTPIKSMLEKNNFVGFAQNSGALGAKSDFLALPRYPLASIYANLETARIKFDTKSFDVKLLDPESPRTSIRNPSATLRFNPEEHNLSQIGCFAGGEAIPMHWLDRKQGLVQLTPTQNYAGRRWRYICTAPIPGERRFYWYSIQWIKTD